MSVSWRLEARGCLSRVSLGAESGWSPWEVAFLNGAMWVELPGPRACPRRLLAYLDELPMFHNE